MGKCVRGESKCDVCVTLALCTLRHWCVNLCMSLGEEAELATKVVSGWSSPRGAEALRTRLKKEKQWSRCQVCGRWGGPRRELVPPCV